MKDILKSNFHDKHLAWLIPSKHKLESFVISNSYSTVKTKTKHKL